MIETHLDETCLIGKLVKRKLLKQRSWTDEKYIAHSQRIKHIRVQSKYSIFQDRTWRNPTGPLRI